MRPILAALIVLPALFAQQPSSAYDVLRKGFADTNPTRRIAAVLALAVARPTPDPVRLIEGMLADKDSGVRAAACAALGEMKSKTSVPRLREALNDKAPEVIFAAAKSLYTMGDEQGKLVLRAVLEGDQSDKSGIVSSSIRDAKLKLHDPKALLILGVTQGAGLAGPFGAGVLIAEMLLKDNQASGKTAAALLLATDKSPETAEAIKTALGDKNWTVRVAAVHSAALLNLKSLYDDIAALNDDKREEVRYAAAGALIRFRQTPPAGRTK